MKQITRAISGSVTAPKGFRAAGVFCDIKRVGTGKGSNKGQKRDLALIVSDTEAAVAGMFTTNQVCAAPVKVSLPRSRKARARAVVVNSGNANACTGERGLADARTMCDVTAGHLGIEGEEVLVCSTGRIGIPLPMDRVRQGIAAAHGLLSGAPESATHAAEAIMTSDTRPKEMAVEFELGGRTVRIGGIAKGAGMIEPGMSPTGKRPASLPLHATMLGFLTTDVDIRPAVLKAALQESVAGSFNRITVDGDMSTNDSVIALANGQAGNPRIDSLTSTAGRKFLAALNQVTLGLALMMVRDGEGVSRVVKIVVAGAKSIADADAAARAVGNSQLVKTSWCGGDPNWGRIMDALGYSPARIVEENVDIAYVLPGSRKRLAAVKRGRPTRTPLEALGRIAKAPEFELHIHLHLGTAAAFLYASDLTEAYVDFNKGE